MCLLSDVSWKSWKSWKSRKGQDLPGPSENSHIDGDHHAHEVHGAGQERDREDEQAQGNNAISEVWLWCVGSWNGSGYFGHSWQHLFHRTRHFFSEASNPHESLLFQDEDPASPRADESDEVKYPYLDETNGATYYKNFVISPGGSIYRLPARRATEASKDAEHATEEKPEAKRRRLE